MSENRHLDTYCQNHLAGRNLKRHRKQAIAGLTLLAVFAVAVPAPLIVPVPAMAQGGVGVVNTPYTLGPNDRINMTVFDVEEYSGEYVVLVDGTLNLPIIGSVNVLGLTLPQATAAISQRYARFVRRPIITLRLLAPRPIVIAVSGEVNRPGTYTLVPGGGGGAAGGGASQFPTVTQAITQAGGVTLSAAIRDVQVQRRSTPGGRLLTFNVNLGALLAGDLSQDVSLRDGDTILIPTVASVDKAETRLLAEASFANREIRPINVVVVGEVARPGPYAVAGGTQGTGGATGAVTGAATGVAVGGGEAGPPTLTKAIQVAGGIRASVADIRAITIRRTTRSGQPRLINVDLWELLRTGDVTEDVLLQEGDIITVPTATAVDPAESAALSEASFSPNTIVVNVVGEVQNPGAIPVPPNTPLNQAVLSAGGFNNRRARKRSVQLVRLNPNGTVSRREIDVDLAQGINEANNPILRNNDVVIVRRSTVAAIGDTLETVLSPITNFLGIINLFDTFGGGD